MSQRNSIINNVSSPSITRTHTVSDKTLSPSSSISSLDPSSSSFSVSSSSLPLPPTPVSSSTVSGSSGSKVNYNYLLYSLRNKVSKLEELNDSKDKLIIILEEENKQLKESTTRDNKQLSNWIDKYNKLNEQYNNINDIKQQLEQELHLIKQQLSERGVELAEMMSCRANEANDASIAYKLLLTKFNEEKSNHLLKTEQLTKLQSQLDTHSTSHSQLLSDYQSLSSSSITYRQQNSDLEKTVTRLRFEIAAAERKVVQSNKWRIKAGEYLQQWEVERKKMRKKLAKAVEFADTLRIELNSHKQLLKYVSIKIFVHQCQLRKQLKKLFEKTVDLTTHSLIEQGEAAPRLNNSIQLNTKDELSVRSSNRKHRAPWNEASKYPLLTLAKSIESELAELQESQLIVSNQKHRWQQVADSFFQRNVELTNEYVQNDEQLQHLNINQQSILNEHNKLNRKHNLLILSYSKLNDEYENVVIQLENKKRNEREESREIKLESEELFDRSVNLRRRCHNLEDKIKQLINQKLSLQHKIHTLQMQYKIELIKNEQLTIEQLPQQQQQQQQQSRLQIAAQSSDNAAAAQSISSQSLPLSSSSSSISSWSSSSHDLALPTTLSPVRPSRSKPTTNLRGDYHLNSSSSSSLTSSVPPLKLRSAGMSAGLPSQYLSLSEIPTSTFSLSARPSTSPLLPPSISSGTDLFVSDSSSSPSSTISNTSTLKFPSGRPHRQQQHQHPHQHHGVTSGTQSARLANNRDLAIVNESILSRALQVVLSGSGAVDSSRPTVRRPQTQQQHRSRTTSSSSAVTASLPVPPPKKKSSNRSRVNRIDQSNNLTPLPTSTTTTPVPLHLVNPHHQVDKITYQNKKLQHVLSQTNSGLGTSKEEKEQLEAEMEEEEQYEEEEEQHQEYEISEMNESGQSSKVTQDNEFKYRDANPDEAGKGSVTENQEEKTVETNTNQSRSRPRIENTIPSGVTIY